jgi:hypothetical protein
LFVLVFGLAMMAFGYSDLSVCLGLNLNCWDPLHESYVYPYNFAESVIIFYIGTIISIAGAVILVGPTVARLLGRLRGPGSDAVE